MVVQKSGLQVIKDFFSTPDRPVTNQELIDLKKDDPEGFKDLVEEVRKLEE